MRGPSNELTIQWAFCTVNLGTVLGTAKRIRQLLHRCFRLRRVRLNVVFARDLDRCVPEDFLNDFVLHAEVVQRASKATAEPVPATPMYFGLRQLRRNAAASNV